MNENPNDMHIIWMQNVHFVVEINVVIVVMLLLLLMMMMIMMFMVVIVVVTMLLLCGLCCLWFNCVDAYCHRESKLSWDNKCLFNQRYICVYVRVYCAYNSIICIQITLHLIKFWYIIMDTIHYSKAIAMQNVFADICHLHENE